MTYKVSSGTLNLCSLTHYNWLIRPENGVGLALQDGVVGFDSEATFAR